MQRRALLAAAPLLCAPGFALAQRADPQRATKRPVLR
jgi:hypothetical protein